MIVERSVCFAASRTNAMAMWKICRKYRKVGTLFFELSSSSTHARYASSSVTIITVILLVIIITALTIDIVLIITALTVDIVIIVTALTIDIVIIITALTIDIVIIVFFFILFLFFLWMQLLPTRVQSCQVPDIGYRGVRFRVLVIPE